MHIEEASSMKIDNDTVFYVDIGNPTLPQKWRKEVKYIQEGLILLHKDYSSSDIPGRGTSERYYFYNSTNMDKYFVVCSEESVPIIYKCHAN